MDKNRDAKQMVSVACCYEKAFCVILLPRSEDQIVLDVSISTCWNAPSLLLVFFSYPFPFIQTHNPQNKTHRQTRTHTYRTRMVPIGTNAGRPPRRSRTSTTERSTTGPRRRYVHDVPRPSVDSSSSDAFCSRHCSGSAAAAVVELSCLLLMVY